MRILTIEDDPRIARHIERRLQADGLDVDLTSHAAGAIERLRAYVYDSVILDVTLPDLDGFSVCQRVRAMGVTTPILMISTRHRISDRIRGLDCGADDYLTKPFVARELSARIRALLRRHGSAGPHPLIVADLSLDLISRQATRAGRSIDLTQKEFELLAFLMRRPGQPVTRLMIAEHVWGVLWDRRTNVIDVVVSNLRRKVEGPGERRLLRPVRGVGYAIGMHPAVGRAFDRGW